MKGSREPSEKSLIKFHKRVKYEGKKGRFGKILCEDSYYFFPIRKLTLYSKSHKIHLRNTCAERGTSLTSAAMNEAMKKGVSSRQAGEY